jgi:hypothetical protein
MMNDRVKNLGVRTIAWGLACGGLLLVVIGFLRIRSEDNIVLQLPYLASDGLGGVALIGFGAMLCIQQQMRQQAARAAAVTESLEEWKDAALAEIRVFLQTTTLELEVRAPAANHRRENVNASLSAAV